MLIYNVTIKVENDIHEPWLQWLKDVHIPDVLATGCFLSAGILRLLETDDSDGTSYAVQYKTESMANYNAYTELHAPEMRRRSFDKWGNRFIAFRSLLQIVE